MNHDEHPLPRFNVAGLIDTGDSFADIKKLIFDEKKYTMEQLVYAMQKNWKGYEDMRLDFKEAPKWGTMMITPINVLREFTIQ